MGTAMSKSNLRPKQAHWGLTAQARTHQYTWMGFGSRKHHASRPSTRTPYWWRIRKHHDSHWCILKIRLSLPRIQRNSSQRSQSCHRDYDKTCLYTYCNDNRQRLSFGLKCDTPVSWCPMYHIPLCNQEACTNYRSPRRNACLDKNFAENVFRGLSPTMAQILTKSKFKLQHNVSHDYRMSTQPNISRTNTLQLTRSQAWAQIYNQFSPNYRFCRRVV